MASSSCFRPGRLSQLEVEITIISANLKPLDSRGRVYYSGRKLRTYAVAWVSTNSDEISETSIDRSGDTNPTWNKMFVIPLKVSSVDQSTLHIKISDDGKQDTADEIIGSVSLPLCEVGIGKQAQLKKMELMSPFGDPRGKLKFRVMVRSHQGMEAYTLKLPPPPPPRPLPKFNPPSAPPLPTFNPPLAPPSPPPLPTFSSPSAPPLPTFNPPSVPPLPTFNPPSPPLPKRTNVGLK